MINKAAYGDLREAGMTDAQAEAVASHIPDWSQCATRQDLADLRQDMGHLESWLIRWMVGIHRCPLPALRAAAAGHRATGTMKCCSGRAMGGDSHANFNMAVV